VRVSLLLHKRLNGVLRRLEGKVSSAMVIPIFVWLVLLSAMGLYINLGLLLWRFFQRKEPISGSEENQLRMLEYIGFG